MSKSSIASTYLFKLGSGVFSSSWHPRYFVFDATTAELSYYKNEREKKSRGTINIYKAKISLIGRYKDREHAFWIKPKGGKKIYLAGKSSEEAHLWRDRVIMQLVTEGSKYEFFDMQDRGDREGGDDLSGGGSRKQSEIISTTQVEEGSFKEESKVENSGVRNGRYELEEENVGDISQLEDPEAKIQEFPEEFKSISKKYQDYLLGSNSDWTVIKYIHDLKISAFKYTPGEKVFMISAAKGLILPILL